MPEKAGGKEGWMMRDFVYPARLKPGTPWQIRRHIRQLERETDRLYKWAYRITMAAELIMVAMLLLCIVHFHITFA